MSSRRDLIRAKIMERVEIDPVTGCWIWKGPTSGSKGRGKDYPRMSLSGQTVAVHLVMWTNEHGYIPGKKQLDHKCRNRLCVNPDPAHTELVTHKENQRRRDRARNAMLGHNGGPALECEEMEASRT
ncbi:HNH endonuclease signature motif containing protein [Sinorhizobium fredii]|uniref:HNH endonuclease signature motif containing protein n=1 Tax=Rhizobium fredii TaxID=380 RepID=UPI0030A37C12